MTMYNPWVFYAGIKAKLVAGLVGLVFGDANKTEIRSGTVDPSAAGGVVAPVGSAYLRSNGTIWRKTGAGNTAWTLTSDHTTLSNIGTNTHPQIDTFIATGAAALFEPKNSNIQAAVTTVANYLDQSVKQAASPTFAGLTLSTGGTPALGKLVYTTTTGVNINNGKLIISDAGALTGPVSGAFTQSVTVPTLQGTGATAGRLILRGNGADTTTGGVDITSSLDSTTTTDGSFTVAGGAGIAKKLFVGTSVTTPLLTNGAAGLDISVAGQQTQVKGTLKVNQAATFDTTLAATTSVSTPSLAVQAGAAVGGVNVSFGAAPTYANASLNYHRANTDPYLGFNTTQTGSTDGQTYTSADSASRVWHDLGSDLFKIDVAASGTAAGAITWVPAAQSTMAGAWTFPVSISLAPITGQGGRLVGSSSGSTFFYIDNLYDSGLSETQFRGRVTGTPVVQGKILGNGTWTVGAATVGVSGSRTHTIQAGYDDDYICQFFSQVSTVGKRQGIIVYAGTGTGTTSDYCQKWRTAGNTELGWCRGDGVWSVGAPGVTSVQLIVNGGIKCYNGITVADTYGNISSAALYGYFLKGTDTTGAVLTYSTGAWASNSDERLKENVVAYDVGLEALRQINPVRYSWKKDAKESPDNIGFIAQNVRLFVPEAVIERDDTDDRILALSPTQMMPVVVKSIQELAAENDCLRSQQDALRARLEALEAKLEAHVNAKYS